MKIAEDWLNEEVEYTNFDGKNKCDRLERIAFLLAVNGGPIVQQYGILDSGTPNWPGREGLDQPEANELMNYTTFIDGISFVDEKISQYIINKLNKYVDERNIEYHEQRE